MLHAPNDARDCLRVQLGLSLDQPYHLHQGADKVSGKKSVWVITTIIVKVVIGIAIIMVAQDAVRHLFEGVVSMCGMRQSPRRHLRSFNVSFTALFFCIQLSAWR